MKYRLSSAIFYLLALTLVACDLQGNNSTGSHPGNMGSSSSPLAQSGADQRGASGTASGRDQRLPDYGSKLTSEVSDLAGLISDLNARITEREIIIDLPADVLFDFDKAEVRSDAVPTLKKLAHLIKLSGDGVIQVNGYTDSLGSDLYNKTLSERRAASVVRWLTANTGIDAARFQAQGFGESSPIAMNTKPDGSDNPEGRQKNRRVEVIIPRKLNNK